MISLSSKRFLSVLFLALIFSFMTAPNAPGETSVSSSTGATVYVPVYTHYFSSAKRITQALGATVLIRNTDLHSPIKIVSVTLYDSSGKKTEDLISKPFTLNALASRDMVLREMDPKEGLGACVIVKWMSEKEVNIPRIEAMMIGTRSQYGISFISEGWQIGN